MKEEWPTRTARDHYHQHTAESEQQRNPEIGDPAEPGVQAPLAARSSDMLSQVDADPAHEDHGM